MAGLTRRGFIGVTTTSMGMLAAPGRASANDNLSIYVAG